MNQIAKLIAHSGGLKATAELVGFSQAHVHKCKTQARAPIEFAISAEVSTKGRFLAEDLAPDRATLLLAFKDRIRATRTTRPLA
jgi:DNA-binding transcriptional regulator YdaS (Cro superfamily)